MEIFWIMTELQYVQLVDNHKELAIQPGFLSISISKTDTDWNSEAGPWWFVLVFVVKNYKLLDEDDQCFRSGCKSFVQLYSWSSSDGWKEGSEVNVEKGGDLKYVSLSTAGTWADLEEERK